MLILLIIGCGTVGTATGQGFLRLGHDVVFYDILDVRRRELKNQGYKVIDKLSPELTSDIVFICTPEDRVEEVVQQLFANKIQGLKVIRSTIPPGTTNRLQRTLTNSLKEYSEMRTQAHICHNPEFFRESVADYEFMNPHVIVIGSCCNEHGDMLEKLYEPLRAPIVRVDSTTSELIKLASNAYLATQISFWNQIHLIAEKLGVNSHVVGKVCALDPRISPYGASMHGKPYGGKCLPKDLEHLRFAAMKLGVHTLLLDAVKEINENMEVRE